MSDCLFCKIVRNEIPSRKIFENETTLAFLDIFPASKGHSLVIPKQHFENIHDATSDIYGEVARSAQQVAQLLKEKLGSEGTTIFQMSNEAGWQTVFHLHMHVIPRWNGDGLHKPWDIAPATDDELSRVFKEIAE